MKTIKHSKIITYLFALGLVFMTISIIANPKITFDAAISGISLWWNVIFPSLLPFFILSELLMGIGVVNAIGVFLEPLMRPVFNVPGVGAFALSLGLASGYPMDAVITSKLKKNNLCSSIEAERLLAFSNTADPLFIFGAVSVGMFQSPELGMILALAHYSSSIIIGFIYSFYGRNKDQISSCVKPYNNIFKRAFQELYLYRQKDPRSIPNLLGDAIRTSMNTILLIGGFIVIFSVCLNLLSAIGIIAYLNLFFANLLTIIGFSDTLSQALSFGLFEIDLGVLAASQADCPLTEKVAIASAIIAWSGLSVHGQVASIATESHIRMFPYIISRFLHAIFSAILVLLLMGPANFITQLFLSPDITVTKSIHSLSDWILRIDFIAYQTCLILLVMFILSMFFLFLKKLFYIQK